MVIRRATLATKLLYAASHRRLSKPKDPHHVGRSHIVPMAAHRQPLNAQLLFDERGAVRCKVRLTATVSSVHDEARALIHDLSETGLRLETASGFDLGETLIVELPFVGVVEAQVVRKDANSYGCQFVTPVSKATVNAALLRSRPLRPVPSKEADISELVVGVNPSLEQMAAWALEFEEVKGARGFQLLGFRKAGDGVISAMVLKNK